MKRLEAGPFIFLSMIRELRYILVCIRVVRGRGKGRRKREWN